MSFLVVGMHRSGTSAVAGLLDGMGAYAGSPRDLLEPSTDNPKGFFERHDALTANRDILKEQNCNWYSVDGFDSLIPLHQETDELIQNVVKQLKPHAPYVLKDPRLCLTLPYWLKHIPDPTIVLVLRHPSAIAHSLLTRNAMPLPQGLALWEHYMTHALHHIANLKVVKVEYETLMQKPDEETERLRRIFALHPLHKPFLEPSLAHEKADDVVLSPAQKQLYEKLKAF